MKPPRQEEMPVNKLSHYDSAGSPRMVDVSGKQETRRTARAHAFVRIAPGALEKLPAEMPVFLPGLGAYVERFGPIEQGVLTRGGRIIRPYYSRPAYGYRGAPVDGLASAP